MEEKEADETGGKGEEEGFTQTVRFEVRLVQLSFSHQMNIYKINVNSNFISEWYTATLQHN